MFFFRFHEPYHISINVLYIFARKQLTDRAHHVILQGSVRENAKTIELHTSEHVYGKNPYALLGLHGNGMRNFVKAAKPRCSAFYEPYYVFTGYTTRYQMILELIPSERR